MINLSDKKKRRLIIGGLGVVCLALVLAISFQFITGKSKDNAGVPSSAVTNSDVNSAGDVAIQDNEPATTSKETTGTADSTGTDQTIQPDAAKSQTPADKPTPQGDTTNPAKTPTYNSNDTSVSQPAEPKAGEKKDGKIYVPGFGWQTETGGQGKDVGSDGDINKQVGEMN